MIRGESLFLWEDKIEDVEEIICFIKTKSNMYEKIEKRKKNKELYPYEIPEIISIPITDGSRGYLKWIEECLKK